MDAELLRQYLEFYQDLGIKILYRQPAPVVLVGQADPEGTPAADLASLPIPPAPPTIRSSKSSRTWAIAAAAASGKPAIRSSSASATRNPRWSSSAKAPGPMRTPKVSPSSAGPGNCSPR